TSTADWPGPPARKNTGSACSLPSSVAGSHAMFSAIRRLPASSGFSGTSKVVQRACTLPTPAVLARVQGSNTSSPYWLPETWAASGGGAALSQAASARQALAAARVRSVLRVFIGMGPVTVEKEEKRGCVTVRRG